MRTMRCATAVMAVVVVVALALRAEALSSWERRMGDLGNTKDAGVDPKLSIPTAPDLAVVWTAPSDKPVNATPIVSDGLLFYGDWKGFFYVVDLASHERLITIDTDTDGSDLGIVGTYTGIQATPTMATVTRADGTEERRIYFAANHPVRTLWCLSVRRILEDKGAGSVDADGSSYVCDGPAWPISLTAPQPPNPTAPVQETTLPPNTGVIHGSPLYVARQRIVVEGVETTRDVLYTPSTGIDCANGVFWARDALTGDVLWTFDPVEVGDGTGGVIWSVPAMNAESIFVTTGDCIQKPQVGAMAESIVALDPATGAVQWHRQARLVDAADLDIGNSPTVVDVAGEDGCQLVVTVDKDGCVYAVPQEKRLPEVGELAFDPLRPTQQVVTWRACLVPGSAGGGFQASGATLHGRTILAQSNQIADFQDDDVNAFALDACDGTVRWASSSVSKGSGEGAAASGMWFQPSGRRLQVMRVDASAPEVLASVNMPPGITTTAGGGGPAIVDGAIYVPTSGGIVVIGVDSETPGQSPPFESGTNTFSGPFPLPLTPGGDFRPPDFGGTLDPALGIDEKTLYPVNPAEP